MEKPSRELTVWVKTTNYGRIRSDRKPTKLMAIYRFGGVICIIGILLVALLFIGLGDNINPGEAITITLIWTAICLPCAIWSFKASKDVLDEYYAFVEEKKDIIAKEKAEIEQWDKNHPHWEAEEFYESMCNAGFSNLDNETQKEKFDLYVKNHNIKIPSGSKSAVEYFNFCKKEAEKAAKLERHAALIKEEAEMLCEYTRYANIYERDKLIKYCEDQIKLYQEEITAYRQDAERVKAGGEAIYAGSKRSEHSWALHGGIASGIAGSAAGLATASSIQQKNAEIRQNNRELSQLIASVIVYDLQKIWDLERVAEGKYKFWKEKLEESKLKLVRNLSSDELMKKIDLKVSNYVISETGAVLLSVQCKQKRKLTINTDLPVTVDGTIKVSIMSDGNLLGHAICVIPFGGVGNSSINIDCICTEIDATGKDLTFEFSPVNLWVVEI